MTITFVVTPRWCLLSVLGTFLAAPIAAGQHITSGERIRVTLSDSSAQIGVLDSVSQDQVWLRSIPQPSAAIPLDRVEVLERSEGRKPAWSKGLGYGALGGAVVGGVLWLAFISGDDEEGDSKSIFAAVLVGSGAVGGALAGIGLSVVLARDRWVVVPRDRWAVGPPVWRLGLRFVP